MLIFVTGISLAARPTAKIVVRGVTPTYLSTTPSPKPFTTISTGLANVGRGSNVWLEARALMGTVPSTLHYDTLTSVTWQVISAPAHSVATIHANDTATGLKGFTAVLVPDSLGQYQIGLTVTTANGTSSQATLYINAANYVGVGGIVGSPAFPECSLCHGDKFNTWVGTPHASMFTNGINGVLGTYTSNCISCHTTGYDKTPTAVNNGFDDRAAAYGWKFPDSLKAGNWDSMKVHYPEVAKLANIQCESCHGPGSLHMGQTDKNKIALNLSVDVCAQCHDAMSHHSKVYQWKTTAHAQSVAEGSNIEYMNRAPCAQCHTAQGFIDVTINGDTLSVPYAGVQPITCSACHDPHSIRNPAQLRRASLAAACVGCHTTRVSSRGLHTSHQGSMLAGSTITPYSGQVPTTNASQVGGWSGWQLPGYTYPNSAHTSITDKCVTCHMAAVPADSLTGKLGDHSFMVAYEKDSTHTVFNTNGCVCHGSGGAAAITQAYVEQSQAEIQSLLDTLENLLPSNKGVPYTNLDTSYHAWTPIKQAASYNYYFVLNDGSFGVHNHDYAKALLTSSIEQLQLTAGAASISSISDVPNDQGKQVQVVWTMFPAERLSIDPVTQYGVWRQDPLSGGTVSSVKFNSIKEMLSKGTIGSKYVLGGAVWTYVGNVPAAKLNTYSYDAPTLFDSTIVSGMKWTTFYVTGTTNGGVVYSSPASAGYSVDNLAPAPPTGLTAKVVANAVNLGWQISLDKDFNYFAIYRGTTTDFDPHGTTAIAKTSGIAFVDQNVAGGATYYYKLSAFDFSGNESKYTLAISAVVLGVSADGGVPNEFALNQNYPNPFNPWTEIKFEVPAASHVKITVYNTLGVQVATLVDRNEEPGYYTITWNGNDTRGNAVASGLYLYKMEAGSFSAVKKMVYMK